MMLDSYICIDTGNSGTKIVYSFPETNKIHSLFMSSALAEVAAERIENQLKRSNWIGFSQLKEQAWLKNGNNLVAVGGLAEKFSTEDRRHEPKYENALYKVLAAIGVIVETHSLSKRKQFKIQLGLLLPWNEYRDRERLVEEIKRLSSEYEFRGRTIKVKIQGCVCYPEGGGIVMSRAREKGVDWFQKQRLGVLMLGDRNWTALYFESGVVKDGASPLNGFSFLLERIIEDAPCLLKPEQLSNAIFTGIAQAKKQQDYLSRPQWQELRAIQSLATARDARFRESEVKDIDRAITMGAREWEEKLKDFIQKIFPKPLTELNVAGGSLPFFSPLIEEYFNCTLKEDKEEYFPIDMAKPFTPVLIGAGITNEVTEALQFNSITDLESAFSARFVDVFGLIKGLIANGEKLKKQKSQQKTRKKVAAANIKD